MKSNGIGPAAPHFIVGHGGDVVAPQIQKTNGTPPKENGVGLDDHKHLKNARKAVHVDVRPAGPAHPIDATIGKNLFHEVGGMSLLECAANPKHLAKLTQAAEIIGTVEKLPGKVDSVAAFRAKDGFALYEHSFPNPDEREPVDMIRARLRSFDKGATEDGTNFHAIGISDKDGDVIAYSHGSIVPSDAGMFYYWQYGCVADQAYMKNAYDKDSSPRDQGILNVIHAANAATLKAAANRFGTRQLGMMWESEPRGLAEANDVEGMRFTDQRLTIHNRAGGRVMMGMTKEGELVNLHLQPRLTEDSEPIALHVMVRPLEYAEGDEFKRGTMDIADAKSMMLGWINNFAVEGFDKQDVKDAEDEIRRRLARCDSVVLLPAHEVPDVVTLAKTDPILEKQVLDMYGVTDLEKARAVYDRAMG